MSTRRITVTLTDAEYDALKAEAEREHRSVGQQAAYRLTRTDAPATVTWQPMPFIPPWSPFGGTFSWGGSVQPKGIYD